MIEIVYINEYQPTDEQIISFFELLSSPQQRQWDFEQDPPFVHMPNAQRIKLYHRPNDLRRGTNHGFWALDGQQVAGMAGVNVFAEPHRRHCGDLGFGVASEYQRQGIGFRLVQAAISKARQLGLRRLEAGTLAENIPSIGLLRKAGFVCEGLQVGMIYKDGQLRDVRLFGLML